MGQKSVPWCARLDYLHCLRSILERYPLTHGTGRLCVTLQKDRTVLLLLTNSSVCPTGVSVMLGHQVIRPAAPRITCVTLSNKEKSIFTGHPALSVMLPTADVVFL